MSVPISLSHCTYCFLCPLSWSGCHLVRFKIQFCCHVSGSTFWPACSHPFWYGGLHLRSATMLLHTIALTIIVHVPTNFEDQGWVFLYLFPQYFALDLWVDIQEISADYKWKKEKELFCLLCTHLNCHRTDSLWEFKMFCSECANKTVIYILRRFLLKGIHTACCLKGWIYP